MIPVFSFSSLAQARSAGALDFLSDVFSSSKGDLESRVDHDDAPEDLVLAVFVQKKKLSSGIFAIQKRGRYYLPLSALSDLVGFHYVQDEGNLLIEGWTASQKDNYLLDVQNHVLKTNGESFNLSEDAILNDQTDDVYLREDVFPQIWPLQLDVNLSTLVLKIIPDEKLPFQTMLDRQEKRKKAELRKTNEEEEENFPFLAYPYQYYTQPVLGISAVAGYNETIDEFVGSVNVNGSNDMLYASANYSMSLGQQGEKFQRPENIRFNLRRQNIHDGALPFGLEDAQIGDVRVSNRELISQGLGGRGATFSTEKRHKVGEFDRVTVDGYGTSGWEVELYLNNELLEFDTVDDRGEYRFEDVSVGYGNNRFRVVLYGPQGQIEERVENYVYQSSMVKKGETVFSGGVLDANRALIPVDEKNEHKIKGEAANFYAGYGIHNKLTTFVTGSLVPDKDNNQKEVSRRYMSVGGIGSVGSTLAQVEAYKQIGGGQAIDVRTLSNFMGFKVNAQASVFSDFESPMASRGTQAKKLETEVSARRVFHTPVGGFGFDLRHKYLKREEGPNNSKFTLRKSLGVNGVRLTNVLNTTLSEGKHENTTGRFATSTRHRRWNWRNVLNYNVYPDIDLTTVQTELRYGRDKYYKTAFRGSYNLENHETRIGAQLTRDFKKYLGSAETSWSSNSGIGFSLRASTSLGPYTEEGSYMYRSNSLLGVGPIASTVYRDDDFDAVYDYDDEPVEGVKIIVNRKSTKEKTNEDGYLMELGPTFGKVNVKVSTDTIEDPYLVPAVAGYRIHPRPGVVNKLEFPLIETGAIDGVLEWNAGGKPIAGVNLELLNQQGDVVQSTKTGADGYYTFEQIPVGEYTMGPNPNDGLNLPFKYVALTPDEMFQFGVNLAVENNIPPKNSGFDAKITKDGTLNVQNIMSLARGYKEKTRKKFTLIEASPIKVAQNNGLQNQEANVTDIRVGQHPGKVRIVLDLSASLTYSITHDPQSNTVYVEMPYATLSAADSWTSDKTEILHSYSVEKNGKGLRMAISVQDGVNVGASGLLESSAGKSERLYIDIEKR